MPSFVKWNVPPLGDGETVAVSVTCCPAREGFGEPVSVMLVAAGPLAEFVERHPTVKMLALSFLLLIGFSLVAEGLDFHISKGYIYAAMGFSVFVEALNLRIRGSRAPVHLRALDGPERREPAETAETAETPAPSGARPEATTGG